MNLAQGIPLAANVLLLSGRQPLSDAAASAVAAAQVITDPGEGILPDDLEDPSRMKSYAKVSSSESNPCDRFTKAVVYVSLVMMTVGLLGSYAWTLVYEDATWIDALLMLPALAAAMFVWFVYCSVVIVVVNGIDLTDYQ